MPEFSLAYYLLSQIHEVKGQIEVFGVLHWGWVQIHVFGEQKDMGKELVYWGRLEFIIKANSTFLFMSYVFKRGQFSLSFFSPSLPLSPWNTAQPTKHVLNLKEYGRLDACWIFHVDRVWQWMRPQVITLVSLGTQFSGRD